MKIKQSVIIINGMAFYLNQHTMVLTAIVSNKRPKSHSDDSTN